MRPRRRGLAFLGATLAVGVVAWVLHRSGQGQLAPPPLGRPDAWGAWAGEREPVVAALAILRLLALGAVWYLAVATVVGGALRLCGAGRLVAAVDRLTIPALRRVLVATTSVTLAAGFNPAAAAGQGAAPTATTATTTAVSGGRPPPTLTMRLLGPEAATPSTSLAPTSLAPTSLPPTPLPPTPLPPAGPAATVTPGPERSPPLAPPPAQAATARAGAAQAGAEKVWTVRPGECFWSIADDVLAQAWGRAPSDAEIVPYWRSLIDANRHLLKDRSNPHLVFPGQVFAVPPPPPAPSASR